MNSHLNQHLLEQIITGTGQLLMSKTTKTIQKSCYLGEETVSTFVQQKTEGAFLKV